MNSKRRMKVGLGMALVAATALPAGASAATVTGTVVAKDAQRGTVATASRAGAVRTLRLRASHLRRARVGARLRASASRLADGTYSVSRVRFTGRARSARVRAAVVRRDARLRRYLVSSGGSVFAIPTPRRARASAGAIGAGDVIVATLAIDGGRLESEDVDDVGDAGAIELEGIFLDATADTLRLAVERRGLVEVAIPAGMTLPAIAAGDEIELLVTIGADGAFTLVSVGHDEGEHGDDDGMEFDEEDGELEIEGVISSLSETEVGVQAGEGSPPVVCAIPAGVSLEGFAVGDEVEAECRLDGDAFVLSELESETREVEVGEDEQGDDHDDDDAEDGDDD